MGRGLSELQKSILRIAYRNHQAGPMTHGGISKTHAYYAEVLHEHFGFPIERRSYIDKNATDSMYLRSNPASHTFDLHAIGESRYRAAQAALSRAVKRLSERGLVEWMQGEAARWSGVNLTKAGMAEAEKLLVIT